MRRNLRSYLAAALLVFLCGRSGAQAPSLMPANDQQCSPAYLGALNQALACTLSVPDTIIYGDNSAATADFPYNTHCGGCPGMSNSKDLWYKFYCNSERLKVSLYSLSPTTLLNPSIALYQYGTGCNDLIPLGCAQSADSVHYVFSNLNSSTEYFLQVSGSGPTDGGNFMLVLNTLDVCDQCAHTTWFDVFPSPSKGGYAAGTQVSMCYTVQSYQNSGGNRLHGIIPELGNGWVSTSLVPLTFPVSADQQGQWIWSTVNGQTGFFYDANGNNTPNDNAGDLGTAFTSWKGCWRATSNTNCVPTDSLYVHVRTTSDSQTGNATNSGCTGDQSFQFDPWPNCCGNIMTTVTNVSCSGVTQDGICTFNAPTVPYNYVVYDQWGGIIDSLSGVTSPVHTIANLGEGQYFIYVYNTSAACWSSTSFVISPSMQLNLAQMNTGCDNVAGSGVVLASSSSTNSGPYTFYWTDGSNGNSSVVTTPVDTIQGLNDGTFYQVTLTDGAGCFVTQGIQVELTPSDDVVFNMNGDSICVQAGDSVHVVGAPAVSGGIYSFAYVPSGSTTTINAATGDFFPDLPGRYVINYSTSNLTSSTCPGSFNDTVLINFTPPAPVATSQQYQQLCLGGTALPTFSASATVNGTVIIWYASTNLSFPIAYGNSYSPTFNSPAGSTYYYAFQLTTSAPYCASPSGVFYEYAILNIQPADAGLSQVTICAGDSVALNGSAAGAASVRWEPSSLVSDSASYGVIAWPSTSTMFYFHAFPPGSGVCDGVDSILVIVDTSSACDSIPPVVTTPSSASVPSGFTPNGDGLNDVWVLDSLDAANNFVTIFNRWGDVVWHHANYDNSTVVWRGENDNANALPEGTYFYLITSNGRKQKGWVELSR